jgi:hypothetical protein
MPEKYVVKWTETKRVRYEKAIEFEDDVLFHMTDDEVKELAFKTACDSSTDADIDKHTAFVATIDKQVLNVYRVREKTGN